MAFTLASAKAMSQGKTPPLPLQACPPSSRHRSRLLRFAPWLLVLLVIAQPAAGCSWAKLPVEQSVEASQAVVWARPIDISNSTPKLTSPGLPASYVQTIHWQVIESWKGPYPDGASFTSKESVSTSSLCGGFTGHKDASPRLLYLFGTEPFTRLSSSDKLTEEETAYFRPLKGRQSRSP